jgi:predicted dehydrogenase
MQKSSQKLRIGIVGAGSIVRARHLPALKKQSDVEIVAVSNSTYESSEKFCAEHVPQATPMRNWADLVALPEIDIIWIGTPPYLHSAVTISALESGKHVFCQARMSNDLAEAEEMLAAAERYSQLVTMLCPPPYGMRGDKLVQKILADETIGKPHHIRLKSFSANYLDLEAPAHWRQRIELSGLNVMALGIYVEVLQRWFGPITGVFARGKILNSLRQGYEVIIPDLLTVLCSFANGAEGVLEFSGVDAFGGSDQLEAYADRGTMRYDFSGDITKEKLFIGRLGETEMSEMEPPANLEGEWHVEEDFLNAVRSNGRIKPRPSFEEGLRYMRVVQAVADSRARNEWVAVKL